MNNFTRTHTRQFFVSFVFLTLLLLPYPAFSHCDTMQGPVIKDAKRALNSGELSHVLKWIGVDQEAELMKNFQKLVQLRKQGDLAREVADDYFFETVVRLHREYEGAPYTGIKATDDHVPTYIKQLDKAIVSENIKPFLEKVLTHTRETIQAEFDQTVQNKRLAGNSIEDGRRYVAAYVDFIHHVQAIVMAVHGESKHAAKTESHGCR